MAKTDRKDGKIEVDSFALISDAISRGEIRRMPDKQEKTQETMKWRTTNELYRGRGRRK